MSNGHPLFIGNAYSEQNRILLKAPLPGKKKLRQRRKEWVVGEAEDVAQFIQYLLSMYKAWWYGPAISQRLQAGFKVTKSKLKPRVKERGGAVEGERKREGKEGSGI